MKVLKIIFEVCRYLLIILFMYTGISKLIGHHLFLSQLSGIVLLDPMAGFISVAVPMAEIVTSLALFFVKSELVGWWMSALLLSMFTIYIAAMLFAAPRLPCSCGGIVASLSWTQHLWLNIALASLCWLKLYQHYFTTKFSMHTKGVS